jgi:hypothetical protein
MPTKNATKCISIKKRYDMVHASKEIKFMTMKCSEVYPTLLRKEKLIF